MKDENTRHDWKILPYDKNDNLINSLIYTIEDRTRAEAESEGMKYSEHYPEIEDWTILQLRDKIKTQG